MAEVAKVCLICVSTWRWVVLDGVLVQHDLFERIFSIDHHWMTHY